MPIQTVAQAMAKGICMAFPPEPEMGNCILPAGHPGPHQDKLHNGWSQSMKKSELKEMIREELVKIRREGGDPNRKPSQRPHGTDKEEHSSNEKMIAKISADKRAEAERVRQAKQKEGDAKRAEAERNRQAARKEADAKRVAADAKRKAVQEIVREEIAKLRRR